MTHEWTGRNGWTLTGHGDRLELRTRLGVEEFSGDDASHLRVGWWWFRRCLVIDGDRRRRLTGLRWRDGASVQQEIARVVYGARVRQAVVFARERQAAFERLLSTRLAKQRWIAYDDVARILAGITPHRDFAREATAAAPLSPVERTALEFLLSDHLARVSAMNEQIMARELHSHAQFFARIEKSPLTPEQARAVVSYDNRVRVIAAAGSGKTSVMVARAAYGIARGFVRPERVLMLAFNADAARELQQRVEGRLSALGIPTQGLRASTFHSFGLSVLGEATGRKPRLASWIEGGKDVEHLGKIVDELRASDPGFAFRWDFFRLIYRTGSQPGSRQASHGLSPEEAARLTTYRGETVKSEGERMIADWLYLHGIDYRYEQSYVHEVADATHGQYRPDFFYPSADVWHEHWALDAAGNPPADFAGYADAMEWKRRLHREHGTVLIETQWHAITDGSGWEALSADLERHGIVPDWNPDRDLQGDDPLDHDRLVRLIRTFMTHVKSSALTRDAVTARLSQLPGVSGGRARMFLGLYWQVHDRWQADLAADNAVDFDDMLTHAAYTLERQPDLARYDLILVDEFQDTSRARARLVRALLGSQGTYLLAVGDDWQAINRFAGADLTVMTDFAEYFGPALTRRLQTTFRTTQVTADVAGAFVSRNPAQLSKTVAASRGEGGAPVTVVHVAREGDLAGAIESHLRTLATHGPATVDVLGRYGFDRSLLPDKRIDGLTVTFRTVHASKGLEADHVIIPRLTTGKYGFPSTIEDDPLLTLTMAQGDAFPHSEERRLLYVALTRARETVTTFTVTGRESPFIHELLEDPHVTLAEADGTPTEKPRRCPGCEDGTLVKRSGTYGEFYGCSSYPRCRQTVKV